jgi:alkyl sulfatase BDS1-like metallo-beta-lactamase superfamily hydrolase
LKEFYGTVEWSVRGVFNTYLGNDNMKFYLLVKVYYLGWFGGDPADLHPHSSVETAKRMIRLAGGEDNLLSSAREAVNGGDAQWGLVCAQSVLRVSNSNEIARGLILECLYALAEREISANGRNYYLTYALEISGAVKSLQPSVINRNSVIASLNGVEIINMLPIRLNSEKCENVEQKVLYVFPDIERSVCIDVRRGVSSTYEVPFSDHKISDLFLTVTVNSTDFVEIAMKTKNKTAAVLSGAMKVEGQGLSSSIALKTFMDYFDDADDIFPPPY